MAFGPIMQFEVGNLTVQLAPFTRDETQAFIAGLQRESVTRFLEIGPQTIESEHAWFDKVQSDPTSVTWGIWVIEDGERKLIGNSAIHHIERAHMHQGTTGSAITEQQYWGRGIASAAHKARTWYGFEKLGLHRLRSGVIQGNIGSRTALERSGYELVYVERNHRFAGGKLRHIDNLECLNPAEWAWTQWWNGERPTIAAKRARVRTQVTLDWARANVTLL